MNKLKIEITFGTQYDKAGAFLNPITVLEAVKEAEMTLVRMFGGCTSLCGMGVYTHNDFRIVREVSQTLVSLVEDSPDARFAVNRLVTRLKTQLNQESVLVSAIPCDFSLL